MSTKKTTRARPADQDAAAPASTSAPDADVAPPHADAAAALLAVGELAQEAAEELAPADACVVCGLAAEYAAIGSGGMIALCRRCIAVTYAAPAEPRPVADLVALQAQESDAEALAALCAAQHQHPRDDVQRAIGVLAGRIAARVLA